MAMGGGGEIPLRESKKCFTLHTNRRNLETISLEQTKVIVSTNFIYIME